MRDIAEIPIELADKWIACDRDQEHIIGAADTFDEAKQLAADQGWREIVIAKVMPRTKWRSTGCHLVCVAAVFIAQMSNALSDLGW